MLLGYRTVAGGPRKTPTCFCVRPRAFTPTPTATTNNMLHGYPRLHPTATCFLQHLPHQFVCPRTFHSHTSHHILPHAYVLAKTLNSTPATTSNHMLLGYPTTASASRTTATCFLHQLPHPTTCFGVPIVGQQQAEPGAHDHMMMTCIVSGIWSRSSFQMLLQTTSTKTHASFPS